MQRWLLWKMEKAIIELDWEMKRTGEYTYGMGILCGLAVNVLDVKKDVELARMVGEYERMLEYCDFGAKDFDVLRDKVIRVVRRKARIVKGNRKLKIVF